MADRKKQHKTSRFGVWFVAFLVATFSLFVWQLSVSTPSDVQTQTEGQVASIPTVVIIDTPTVEVETGQVVSKTGIVVISHLVVPQLGVVIDEKQTVILVEPGSAGEKAGVQLGDILERIEDIPLILEEDKRRAKQVMGNNREGIEMHLTVIRAGETLDLPFVPGPPLRAQPDVTQVPADAKQEPTPTITPVWAPFYYF